MPRPRADGTAARHANRRKLTDLFVQSSPKVTVPQMVWDTKAPGLALSIRPLICFERQSRAASALRT